jgi:hypothetical protein
VKGDNPSRAEVTKLVDAAVEDVVAAHATEGPTQMLPLRVWKELAHRVVFHESGGEQFGTGVHRAPFRERTPFQCHGLQSGMPNFGAPAGYGIGQHDPPRSVQDMWNFHEHIRIGIEELVATIYARSAYDYLRGLCPSLSASRSLDKAIFLRETVRGYTGGREFVYEDDRWVMRPWILKKKEGEAPKRVPLPAKRIGYVDTVLGTTTTYPHVVAATESTVDLAGTALGASQ